MAVRIISSIVAIPILMFFIIAGGLPLSLAVLVLSLIGMFELYRAVSGRIKAVHFVGFAAETLFSFAFCNMPDGSLIYASAEAAYPIFVLSAVSTFAILIILVFGHKTNTIIDGSITLFGFFYVGVTLSLILFLRSSGMEFVWLPFIFAFGSDTGAYFIGSKFGRHKLCPELSPKKSVEGAVGGVVSAALLTFVYLMLCNRFYKELDSVLIACLTAVSVFGAVMSQIGDLAASSIKRFTGIKDYGKLMPGHGGVLDRFDSVLFTVPTVYLALFFCERYLGL